MEERQEKFPPPPNIIQTLTLFRVYPGVIHPVCAIFSLWNSFTNLLNRGTFNNPVLQVIALLNLCTFQTSLPSHSLCH